MFRSMQESLSEWRAPPQVAANASLELHYVFTHIFLEGVLETSETLYDKHTALFARILVLSERLITVGQSEGHFRLSLDAGVIAPLCLVALKSRETGLKRRAISLLRCSPEQEGMWHRDSVLAVALWKLREEGCSEEGGTVLQGPIGEDARVHSERATTRTNAQGRQVTVMRYKKGHKDDQAAEHWNEQVINLPLFMGEVL
ncbi:hypothetical protein LTR85_007948 [Meristemomyces frigidus]|nr:hypothetical protein LTR85_007948 [Meristemomyces frigidus]